MKMILLASALALSTAAMAQTTPADPSTQGGMATTPATGAPDAMQQANPGSASTTPGGDTSSTPPATDSTSTPSGAPTAGDSGMASGASSTDDSNLPTCSKTVTDKCKSGSKSGGHAHKAMHHKKK